VNLSRQRGPKPSWIVGMLVGWAAILGVAAFAGYYVSVNQSRVLMIIVALPVVTAAVWWLSRPDVIAEHRWIPIAWLALALLPDVRFQYHSTDPSISNLTTENIAQLVVYALDRKSVV